MINAKDCQIFESNLFLGFTKNRSITNTVVNPKGCQAFNLFKYIQIYKTLTKFMSPLAYLKQNRHNKHCYRWKI